MCGRFSVAINKDEFYDYLYSQFDLDVVDESLLIPRYNVAPGHNVITVINDGTDNRVGEIKWGLVPSFAKDENIGFKMINARGETLEEKVSFKVSYETKRCVVLADGYYEWNNKVPYRITKTDSSVFSMAALWEKYVRADGSNLFTCTIITTEANDTLSEIHNRMPVILKEEDVQTWLNPNNRAKDVNHLLVPFNNDEVMFYEVSTVVNSVKNQNEECIAKK